ncbi:unnamed protein product [Ilex paraguariensis]|uniref:Uncharacterized protein n=1 Tax=Ilex paraguariensis TaxID=185542 RepID=A0ABC8QQE7_9AQUA
MDFGYKPNDQFLVPLVQWTTSLLEQMDNRYQALCLLIRITNVGWWIWKASNEAIFELKDPDPRVVVHKVTRSCTAYQALLEASPIQEGIISLEKQRGLRQHLTNRSSHVMERTTPPPLWLLRGLVLEGISSSNRCLHSETMSICEMCLMAISMKSFEATVESDNREVVQLSVLESMPPWEIAAIPDDIRVLKRKMLLSFSFIPRA